MSPYWGCQEGLEGEANLHFHGRTARFVHGGLEEPDIVDLAEERIRKSRDSGMWYAVAGVALLFAGSISTALAIGGVLMVVYGASRYIVGSVRLARYNEDPWKDPELDAWEDTHYGEGQEIEGDDIIDESPDAAWGGQSRNP